MVENSGLVITCLNKDRFYKTNKYHRIDETSLSKYYHFIICEVGNWNRLLLFCTVNTFLNRNEPEKQSSGRTFS